MARGFTALLAEAIGPEGAVFAFDENPAALDATRATLTEHGVVDRVELLSSDILDTDILSAYTLHTAAVADPGEASRR